MRGERGLRLGARVAVDTGPPITDPDPDPEPEPDPGPPGPPPPTSPVSETLVTQSMPAGTVIVLAFICKSVARSPDPNPSCIWG